LLLLMADWKMTPDAMDKIAKCNAYGRLETHTREFIDACAKYYQNGLFPSEKFVSLALPSLITSELKLDQKT
ncbi:effector protein Tle3 domain-containing protein, partial [Burkholderia pseudomallei]|uniref:effector protein Tle3 domain-containing protein n=1 Tax=Burkholderia pseudomallei TaxID=28450 RepID=UPI0009C88A3D